MLLFLVALLLTTTWGLPGAVGIPKAQAAAPATEKVYGFGSGQYGKLGPIGSSFIAKIVYDFPVSKQVSAGGDHALVLTEDGKVYSVGSSGYGQGGAVYDIWPPYPTLITGLPAIKQVAAGALFSLVLSEDGKVYSFGGNYSGQLGRGDVQTPVVPGEVAGLPAIKQISTGADHALALTEDGEVYGFGSNNHYQLGLNDDLDRSTPQKIPGLSHIKQISAGGYHSLALAEDGTVYAFGENASGQLGLGDFVNARVPQQVKDLPVIKQIDGGLNHSLLLAEDGTVYATGLNTSGQLGLGTSPSAIATPRIVPGLSAIQSVSAGSRHSLVTTENGTAYGFGANDSGQLGIRSYIGQVSPQPLPLAHIKQLEAGGDFSLVIVPERRVSFDSTGGSSLPTTITASGGKIDDMKMPPTKKGNLFEGWYEDIGLLHPFDFDTPIFADTTLYAKWLDISRPSVALSTTAGNPTNQPFVVKAEFDEPVTQFDTERVVVTGAEVGKAETVSASVYAFTVTPTSSNGTITVQLAQGAAKDLAGHDSLQSDVLEREFNSVAPTLKLNGEARMPVGMGTTFVDPGATAQDVQGVSLTENISVTGKVFTEKDDVYELTYSVSDSALNTSTVTRSVYVIEPPLVIPNGEIEMEIEEDTKFVDEGASASDAFHGDLSDLVVTEGSVDTSRPGTYTLTYKVTNPIGQTGQAERQVKVTEKAQPPVVEPPIANPPTTATPAGSPTVPTSASSVPVSSSDGNLTLAAGQAGQVSMGSEVYLQIPVGATNRRIEIRMNALTAANNGLTAEAKALSTVYQLTKTVPANFLRPVSLTLSFDPSKLAQGEQAAVFYQNEDGGPWVRMDGGTIQQGRNAVGASASNSAVITVLTDHFTKFAVLAVKDTTPSTPETDASENGGISPAIAFTDISGHWAAEAITESAALGFVKGYADGTFRPSKAVTRAEFATILVRALAPVADEAASEEAIPLVAAPFADQSSIRDWAGQSIAQARVLGWIQGDASGNFRPNDAVTRAEMAAMLYRALTLKGADEALLNRFADADSIPAWAREAAAALTATDVLQGDSGGKFAPNAAATRAEIVQVLMRVYQ
ncbi:immunoglobulin-like domain-containing protein [Saccharibacillus sacchari]|uniref:Immunoglobulin-like domain-containing protein n=1 Tax=Saccharibacillus sacchari TaxID=456493 RepID=A0ACC6P7L8_9BACL